MTTPAWSSAETGVGASITSVSQPCAGISADLNTAATARQVAIAQIEPGTIPARASAAIVAMSVVS